MLMGMGEPQPDTGCGSALVNRYWSRDVSGEGDPLQKLSGGLGLSLGMSRVAGEGLPALELSHCIPVYLHSRVEKHLHCW